MFHAERFEKFIVVSGYADGSHWIIADGGGALGFFGPGKSKLWQHFPGEIRLHDVVARAAIGTIAVKLRDAGKVRAVAGAGGDRLYIIAPSPRPENESDEDKRRPLSDLVAVDLTNRCIVARRHDQPVGAGDRAVVTPDGSLLLSFIARRDDAAADVVARIDGEDFSIAESVVPVRKVPESYVGIHWHAHSPDGRWWLRFDDTSFPMVERAPAPGLPPRKYYGVTMQIWSAFPLKFERRVVAHWLKAENLPDATHVFKAVGYPPPPRGTPPIPAAEHPHVKAMTASVPERDRIYTAISDALDRPGATSDAPFLDRQAFGTDAISDPQFWSAIKQNLEEMFRRSLGNVTGWDPGGDAVWLDRVGFLTCVGMDGSASPQIWSERFGLRERMMVPFANLAEVNIAQPGRKLLAIMPPREEIRFHLDAREGGALIIDGAPVEERFEPVMIAQASDGWISGNAAIPENVARRPEFRKIINEIARERSIVRVTVRTLDDAGRAKAIYELADIMDPDFGKRADDNHIDIRFVVDGREVPERKFFLAIGPGDQDWAVPVLRRALERCTAASIKARRHFYQTDDHEGGANLAHAALRLGELDHDSLPIVRAYGSTIDGGHEYTFATQTVPAVIKAHGWTPEVTRFVFWVMLHNFYNSYDSPLYVWRDLGLYSALASDPPELVAEGVAAEFSGRGDWSAMHALLENIGPGADAWERRFFEELERRVPGSTLDIRHAA